MRFGNNLRVFRKARGLSLSQVGTAVGIDRSYLSRIERGLQGCSDHYKVALSLYFGVPITRLFFQELDVSSESTNQPVGVAS